MEIGKLPDKSFVFQYEIYLILPLFALFFIVQISNSIASLDEVESAVNQGDVEEM